jgi:hydrogenase maturation protease
MATPPSVSALAGTHGDYFWRLLLIGVQPLEFEDFGGGLRPAVNRRIVPAIGITPERLARRGIPLFSAWRRGKRR